MIISYNWLNEYLPELIEPEKLSKILTSIGLEVESLEKYEAVKGGLQGLVIGEVMTCENHPDADKLKLTTVNIGTGENLQIVCGAPNVAVGQKVVVATIGSTIYPLHGEPMTMKKAKIRGVESHGMICAEDEMGLGESHAGIMILPADTKVGITAATFFKLTTDYIFEIGLTPNRIDAMSHLGVARDVCAYLSHHIKKDTVVKLPFKNNFKPDNQGLQMEVVIENAEDCQRYSGVSIQGVTIAHSPKWLQQKLKSIGLKPINNIVDITNFILHETGQPLHAFDADAIIGNKVIIKRSFRSSNVGFDTGNHSRSQSNKRSGEPGGISPRSPRNAIQPADGVARPDALGRAWFTLSGQLATAFAKPQTVPPSMETHVPDQGS